MASDAANYVTTQSGLFSAGTTWVGGTAPSAGGDTWSNQPGLTLTYDVNNQSSSGGWGACTNAGTLTFANGATTGGPVYFLMNGNFTNTGVWQIGTNNNPITYTSSNTPNCYIQFSNTAVCNMKGTTMGLQWYGTPHLSNTTLSAVAQLAATSITVASAPSWLAVNDIFWMSPTNTTQGQGGDYYMVSSVAGNVVSIVTAFPTGQTNFYPGMTFKSSVPTASRPVGTIVSFFGSSVMVLESTQRTTLNTVSNAQTNIIVGCTFQNLGKGFATVSTNWSITNNTANNCGSGGLAYISCSGWTVSNTTNINSGALFTLCWGNTCYNSPSTNDTIGTTITYYQPIQYDNTKWISVGGNVTNISGTNIYCHTCSAGYSNAPIPMTLQFSVRPGAYRNIYISTQATNNVQYYAGVALGTVAPSLTLVNAGNNGGAWSNTTLSYSNSTTFPLTASIWLASQGGVSSNGFSMLNLGQDMVVNKY